MTAVKKSGLGRGLEALFSDVQINIEGKERRPIINGNEILYIDIHDIKPNINQPRKNFSDEKIEELAQSIRVHGIIQPIMVQKCESGYEIIAGERRWRAARKAQIKDMQREDLNVIEEAAAFEIMSNKFSLTQDEIAKSVGKSRPYITNTLRLLKLDQEIQGYIIEGKISGGHAKAILSIKEVERQLVLAKEIIEKDLSVRETEVLAAKSPKELNRKKSLKRKTISAEIRRLEEDLKTALGTKVSINQGKKHGKIEIEYYSKDELERLIELLTSLK
jgi:ParB family chromosome partitioning protein